MLSCNNRLPYYPNKVMLEFSINIHFQDCGLSGLNELENSLTKFADNQKNQTFITSLKLREMSSNK